MSYCILRPFLVDVTPPIGDYLCGGLHNTSIGQETALHLRGLIVDTDDRRFVMAVVDYCYLAGRSQQRFVTALAQGAGIPVEQATLHSNHVHDAPLIDEEAAEILKAQVPDLHNEAYFDGVLTKTRQAMAAALATEGIRVTSISFSQGKVEQFASNRRVIDENGVCQVRWSVCRNETVRNAPEGNIDPMLDQVTFYDADGQAVVCLHFYASHPQVSDGRRLISDDTVGVALRQFEAEHPQVFSLYFTGCSGDITAGKYTTTDRAANRPIFGNRLFHGMQAAFGQTTPQPIQQLDWTQHNLTLPLAPIEQPAEYFLERINDAEVVVAMKYLLAMKLHRLQNAVDTYPFHISRLRINDIDILFLPTELLLAYQTHAKSRGSQVAVAAYGDCFLKYLAHDAAFDEGGYEVEWLWSEAARGAESLIHQGIDKVLEK